MADYTKTITNSVNLFGGGPSTKWGEANSPYTMVWGTALWGQGFSLVFSFDKLLDNSVITSDLYAKETQLLISNDLSINADLSNEGLSSGDWNVVFVPSTTEAENRVFTTWSAGSNSSTTYTCLPAGSTSWS